MVCLSYRTMFLLSDYILPENTEHRLNIIDFAHLLRIEIETDYEFRTNHFNFNVYLCL